MLSTHIVPAPNIRPLKPHISPSTMTIIFCTKVKCTRGGTITLPPNSWSQAAVTDLIEIDRQHREIKDVDDGIVIEVGTGIEADLPL